MKTAYHRIQFDGGKVVDGPVVVETSADGQLQDWHPLLTEEPQTIWKGGTYKAQS